MNGGSELENEIRRVVNEIVDEKLEKIANPIRLVNEAEAMQILACDKVTLASYRKKGLRHLNTRPCKYRIQDISSFIDSNLTKNFEN